MKNEAILKQNLLLVLAIFLSWVIGYWLDFEKHGSLFFFSHLMLLLFFMPFSILYVYRIRRGKSLESVNKAFQIVGWIFVFIYLLPFIYSSIFDMSLHYSDPFLSPLQILIFDIQNFSINFEWLSRIFKQIFPNLTIISLIYLAIKTSKQPEQA